MKRYPHTTKHRIPTLAAALAMASLLCLPWPSNALGEAPPAPFQPGETLVFELRWEFVKAGEATLRTLPMTTVNGAPAHHFQMTARSVRFLDMFYKVRDRIDAYADTAMTHALRYEKQQLEGKTHRDIVVRFDWDAGLAHYTNFGNPREPLPLMPGTFDPLSAFFWVRAIPLTPGAVAQRPVTDGKKNVMGRATVVRRETIEVSGQSFDTFLIEPELEHVGGVFEKSDDATVQVWVTADTRRIPVRISSKVAVGSFIAELISASGLAPLPPPAGPGPD